MKLTINTTPKSITISDDNGNKLTVLKGESGITIQSVISDVKVSRQVYKLQKEIKRIVQNPKDNRDNYRIRFDRLSRTIAHMDAHSFLSLIKRIEKNEELQQA